MTMALRGVVLSLILILFLRSRESMSMDTRIVGGSRINITAIPFMLSLRVNGAHICGATIISRNWGLTAAHCVASYGMGRQNYSVRSGSSLKDKGGKIQNVTNVITHQQYNESNGDFDIAVFRVKPAFRRSKTTRPIDLPGNLYVDDKWAIIAGWGYYTARGNVLSETLRYARVPKIDRTLCSNDYRGRYEITPTQVCYGYQQGGKDACKGDSGGPIFTNSSIILGITSWGEDCGALKSPGVYTTIFLVLDWISEKTGVKSRF